MYLFAPHLFVQCYVDLPQLHSFPTRRSSDLSEGPSSWEATATMNSMTIPAMAWWATRANTGWSRSEEHTSELQSRGHLVCRLLLEKKKNKIWSKWFDYCVI